MRLSISLKDIEEFMKQYDNSNTCFLTQDILLDLEDLFGPYKYDADSDKIYWTINRKTFFR